MEAKAQVGAGGFGCEPASAASVAGVKLLREQGVIAPSDRVAAILTGHELKDPDATVDYHRSDAASANAPVSVPNDAGAILEALEGLA